MGVCCYECIITAQHNPPASPKGAGWEPWHNEPPRRWVRPPAPAHGTAAGAQAGPEKHPGCGCQQRLCRERRGTVRQAGARGGGGEQRRRLSPARGAAGRLQRTTGLPSRNAARLFLGQERAEAPGRGPSWTVTALSIARSFVIGCPQDACFCLPAQQSPVLHTPSCELQRCIPGQEGCGTQAGGTEGKTC